MIHAIIGLTLIQVSGWALIATGHHLAGIAILATTAAALMTIGHINAEGRTDDRDPVRRDAPHPRAVRRA